MGGKTDPDWEAIEREYRAGQLSVREIARTHEISHTAINKRAKECGWKRDLADKVRAAVKDRVLREVANGVSTPVSSGNARQQEEVIVEANALLGADVERRQRGTLGRAHAVAAMLFEELEEATKNRAEIEAAIEEETKSDRSGKRRAMMLRAVDLPQRATTAASLSVAVKNLIMLERRTYNLDEPGQSDAASPLSELHKQISGRSFRPVE